MNLTPVTSSNIASVGWEPVQSQGTGALTVAFKSGAVHQYADVPKAVYEGMLRAESKGHYFAEVVRNGGYRSRRIR
jgi:hypothetical protein